MDATAEQLLAAAARALDDLARALPPVPLALGGSIAERLQDRSPRHPRAASSPRRALRWTAPVAREAINRLTSWDLLDFHPRPAAASPLYVQLAQNLQQAIQDGRFKADEALPSGARAGRAAQPLARHHAQGD